MLKHKDMYIGVLHRLDKFGSGAVDLEDFNYHVNEAMRRVVNGLVPELESKDEEKAMAASEQLQILLRPYEATSSSVQMPLVKASAPLPADCLSLRNCLVTFCASSGVSNPAFGQQFKVSAERLTPAREASFSRPETNYYTKPKVRRPYYQLLGGRIAILAGSTSAYFVESLNGTYIKYPEPIALLPGDGADGISEESNKSCEFGDRLTRKIINETTIDIMVKFGDDRLKAEAELQKAIL
jgi:hypothetical protein